MRTAEFRRINQAIDANGPTLITLVERDSAIPNHPGIVADDREAITAAMHADADVILTSGGASVGQEDHVPVLLAELDELAVHGVAMRPAGPISVGTFNDRLVVVLPGNPLVCLWGHALFAIRAIRRMRGGSAKWPYRNTTAILARELKSRMARLDHVRVHCVNGKVDTVAINGGVGFEFNDP